MEQRGGGWILHEQGSGTAWPCWFQRRRRPLVPSDRCLGTWARGGDRAGPA